MNRAVEVAQTLLSRLDPHGPVGVSSKEIQLENLLLNIDTVGDS